MHYHHHVYGHESDTKLRMMHVYKVIINSEKRYPLTVMNILNNNESISPTCTGRFL